MAQILTDGSSSRLLGRKATATAARWLAGGIPAANCIAAYEPMDAADLAASYINLANPGTYNAAPGIAPTHAPSTGWIGDNNAYLTTGITPAAGWSMIVKFSGLSTSDNDQILAGGWNSATTNFYIQPRAGGNLAWFGKGGEKSYAAMQTAGVMAIAGTSGWLNGAEVVTAIGAWSGTNKPIFILAASNATSLAASKVTGNLQRLYIYDIDITSYMAALTTAINS